MKLLRSFFPNLAICLDISLLIVVWLDLRNPRMGFLLGKPFLILVSLAMTVSMLTALILYMDSRREAKLKFQAEAPQPKEIPAETAKKTD